MSHAAGGEIPARRAAGTVAEIQRTVGGHPVYVLPLGYDRPPLSLNDRGRSRGAARAKAAKVRALRADVALRLRALLGRPSAIVPHIHVQLHYVPRDRRIRDADNLVATLKPCIDALHLDGKAGSPRTPLVINDDPAHVSWSPPRIHLPDDHGPRLWLVITTSPTQPQREVPE